MLTTDDYEPILRGEMRLIDLRAPIEFAKGAPVGAVNLPILDDGERAVVGTTFKLEGPEAARTLGHRLVSGDVRAHRIAEWIAELERHDGNVVVYCWRGGDRSRIAQHWLANAGRATTRIEGGFRALRRAGLEVIERAASSRRWLVIGGRTGSGKTDLLARIDPMVDLEALANHRGSVFGAMPGGQPTQVQFDLDLAARLLHLPGDGAIAVENESVAIGRRCVPTPIVEVIRTAPIVRLEIPLGERISNVHRDYVLGPLDSGTAPDELECALLAATARVASRLGPERDALVRGEISRAFRSGRVADVEPHTGWIRELLTRYYDPLYDRQMRESRRREVFRGGMTECLAFLRDAQVAPVGRGSGLRLAAARAERLGR